MKTWQKILSTFLAAAMLALGGCAKQEQKACCLCSSFRYHAPCLIDLKTGEMIELALYLPHHTVVAELAEEQPEQGTFSFIRIGNVPGTTLSDSKTIELHIPDEIVYAPALCPDCKKQLPLGHRNRYILADLYSKEEKVLIPIKADVAFSLRCYAVTTEKSTEKGGISVTVQGTLAP